MGADWLHDGLVCAPLGDGRRGRSLGREGRWEEGKGTLLTVCDDNDYSIGRRPTGLYFIFRYIFNFFYPLGVRGCVRDVGVDSEREFQAECEHPTPSYTPPLALSSLPRVQLHLLAATTTSVSPSSTCSPMGLESSTSFLSSSTLVP